MALVLSLGTEWMAGHVRGAALDVANWSSERLKALSVQPVYLHGPRVLGYVVAPIGLWALIICSAVSAWKAVFQ